MAGVEGQGPFLPAALYQVSCRLLGCRMANILGGGGGAADQAVLASSAHRMALEKILRIKGQGGPVLQHRRDDCGTGSDTQ